MARKDAQGRFAPSLELRGIRRVVRDVAVVANAAAPLSVTRQQWDAARAAAGWPHSPTASAIARHLGRPWRRVVLGAFESSVAHAFERDRGIAKRQAGRDLRAGHQIEAALAIVGHTLGGVPPTPDAYDRGRDSLVSVDARRRTHPMRIGQRLPTASQLVTAFGTWDECPLRWRHRLEGRRSEAARPWRASWRRPRLLHRAYRSRSAQTGPRGRARTCGFALENLHRLPSYRAACQQASNRRIAAGHEKPRWPRFWAYATCEVPSEAPPGAIGRVQRWPNAAVVDAMCLFLLSERIKAPSARRPIDSRL